MLGQRYFVRRHTCVVCESVDLTQIYSCPMDASPVHDFIQSHYRAQGVIDWTVLAGANFDVMECDGCGLIFQRSAPTPEMLGIIYTQMIGQAFLTEAENDLLTIGNFQEVAGELAVLFSMAGKAPKDITFLDYGFGHGRWARVARAMGATVYATEIGDEKQRLGASLGVIMIDDAEIDVMQFDIVHTEQVLEHLVEPAQQFKRLARATRGVMKVAVPRPRRLKALLQARGMATESPFDRALQGLRQGDAEAYVAIVPLEHLNAFTPRSMGVLAAANSMKIVSRVRQATISLDLSSVSRFLRSVAKALQMTAKMIRRPETGYYLFRPAA